MIILRICEQVAQDLRYALRMMAARPLFTAMAAVSLALGIGANTAIYSFMDTILMRALPVHDPQSLVLFNWHSKDFPKVSHNFSGSTFQDPKTGLTSGNFPYPAFELFRERNPMFQTVFAFARGGRLNIQIHNQADLADCQYVSGAFFGGLGVPPAAGRLIDESDDRPGAPAVADVSYSYAQRRFGEAPKAIGQIARINDKLFTIVGVTPPEFFGVSPGARQDVYLPMHSSLLLDADLPDNPAEKYIEKNSYWVEMMGRLRPGVTRERAQAALAPQFHRFVEATARNGRERADLPALLLQEGAGGLGLLRRQFSKPLYVLMTMVGLMLAIACANIANLLLARAAGRRREMALRLSLGAGRWRVVRQLLTESLVLAGAGGLLGVAFAEWGVRGLGLLIANGRDDFHLAAGLNWHVLAVTAALAAATGMLFGLAPALQATRVDLASSLKQTRSGERRLRISWFRISLSQVLAVAQIAISLLLLVAAGLFVRTLNNLNSVSVGFNREHLLLVTLNARQAGYGDDALRRFYLDLQSRFRAIPGVRQASMSNYALVSGSRSNSMVKIPGDAAARQTDVLSVGTAFLSTMQIPLLLGRDLDNRDVNGDAHSALVNEAFVKQYLSGSNPIGRQFTFGDKGPQFTIVGVAASTRLNSVKDDVRPLVCPAYARDPKWVGQMVFELRAAGDPMSLAATARQVVRQADARVPVSRIVTESSQIEQTIGQERVFAMLCTCFAILALAIACVGLYGMMAYSVARRTNEIGIRMALGAQRRRLLWMVLREVLAMSAVGLALGIPAAYAASRLVAAFLFQMKPGDPISLTAAGVALLTAALAAGYGPAWRASRVDPWTALRDE
jgi:macrolide transport system ATP-binding/permease protein